MPKRITAADLRGRNPLTHDEAATLAVRICETLSAEDVARLLLLVHAFTYEDPSERESMSSTIEDRLISSLPRVDEFRYEAMRCQLEDLRKGDE